MNLLVFCVRDQKMTQYGNPFVDNSVGSAIRNFSRVINDNSKDNMMYMYPDDFELFHCGHFNLENGLFDTHLPKSVALGSMVKVRE